ncbi:MAG: glycosyltransferase, partial [bacterium]|nr:glycosyltransferase [bacterium]
LDLLLDMWKTIGDSYRTHELIIAGEQDIFMKRLMDRVASEKIERVSFPGKITDAELAGYLDHADLFVFPSSHEGFGLPPIEALAHGCPVVAAYIPALVEILPKEGVFFFRNNDRDAMIRVVDMVLKNPADAKEQARRAKDSVTSRFNWKLVAERTLETYERVFHA